MTNGTVRSRWRLAPVACVAAAVTATVAMSATAANAATPATAGSATVNACATTAVGTPSVASTSSASTAANVAGYKATHDTGAARLRALTAGSAARDAGKNALIRSGQLKLRAPQAKHASCGGMLANTVRPNAVLSYLVQYPQVNGSFCGPATISEMSATVPGPSPTNLDQWSVAAYMDGNGGNTILNNGTNVDQEVNGLNHFVGVPDFGRVYYGFVGMSYNPTAGDRSTFEANLDTDVSQGSPVAGDAWEVPGGPHLVGHPNQEIFHYFEIGGRSGSSTYYADSATSVWSSVPPYSWIDTGNLETILGGRGYIW